VTSSLKPSSQPRPPRPLSSMKAGFTTSLTGESQPKRTFPATALQYVHSTRGNDRNLHCARINVDYADTFLTPAMESAQADRERFVAFHTEFLAGNLPVFWSFIRIE
jgi:hypothetical protein